MTFVVLNLLEQVYGSLHADEVTFVLCNSKAYNV